MEDGIFLAFSDFLKNIVCGIVVVAIISCFWTQAEEISAAAVPQKRLALLQVGVVDRLSLLPTFRHVVAPAAAAGFQIDYYLYLAASWNKHYFHNAMQAGIPIEPGPYAEYSQFHLQLVVEQLAKEYGASFVSLTMYPGEIEVPAYTDELAQKRRIFAFCPTYMGKPEVCTNVVRRFKKIEVLWQRARAFAGTNGYSHVILLRDDAGWHGDLNMEYFTEPNAVYSLYCQKNHPHYIQDKILIFGWKAASKMLTPFSDLFNTTNEKLDNIHTPEQHFWAVAVFRDVELVEVDIHYIPHHYVRYLLPDSRKERIICIRDALTSPCPANEYRFWWQNSSKLRKPAPPYAAWWPSLSKQQQQQPAPSPCYYDWRWAQCGSAFLPHAGCRNFENSNMQTIYKDVRWHLKGSRGSMCLSPYFCIGRRNWESEARAAWEAL